MAVGDEKLSMEQTLRRAGASKTFSKKAAARIPEGLNIAKNAA